MAHAHFGAALCCAVRVPCVPSPTHTRTRWQDLGSQHRRQQSVNETLKITAKNGKRNSDCNINSQRTVNKKNKNKQQQQQKYQQILLVNAVLLTSTTTLIIIIRIIITIPTTTTTANWLNVINLTPPKQKKLSLTLLTSSPSPSSSSSSWSSSSSSPSPSSLSLPLPLPLRLPLALQFLAALVQLLLVTTNHKSELHHMLCDLTIQRHTVAITYDLSETPAKKGAPPIPQKRSKSFELCMNSKRRTISHRTSSNRHRKLQPFRYT
ncbi:integrator complex subunit 6 homolog isoform X1 [Drosophila mojavensis]|uniref:integrator complex subunit 6 homolog isoform X1 n=1 Tax=Drosophila mojavensis TaxID=7230 RepID=UPI001CD12FC6|nr:integrator complex subunit 6 homolog isoform X1 [Drosophila mojavensis]